MRESAIPTIAIGHIAPDGTTKVVDILTEAVVLAIGESAKEVKVSFVDCEKIWGI